ncbi:MAG: ATP-binding cassette domain-containing protein [Burkholderiales bacterium]|nr:ATP-binding cassette domain-containing protein [Burkholderiales bacterium]
MIEFSAVTKRYPGGHEALKNISFTVADGELLFITGHSGAGKSTLLKLLPVIERATSGSVIVNGQNVASMRPAAIPYLRRNIGQVFQDQKLLYDRSVFDNVMLPLAVTGVNPKDAAKRARAALDKVGLLPREKANPIALSGGEQQRLAIARAIVNRPSIIIADEPTSNLDADYAGQIIDLFVAFHQVGVTLLIATHDESAVARAAASTRTRSVQLKDGALI